MKISIQTRTIENTWDECVPVLHATKDWDEAVTIAYALSRQLSNRTVRLVKVPDAMEMNKPNIIMIGNISGTYIQSI